MSPQRRAAFVLASAAATVTLVAGCSATTSGSGSPASPAGGTTSSSSPGSSAPALADLTGLVTAVKAASAGVTSVHLESTTSGGTTGDVTSAGDAQLSAGQTQAFSVTTDTGSTTVALIYVDGQGYAKLPEAAEAGKPWIAISSTSSDPQIAAIGTAFDTIKSQSGLSQYTTLLDAASGFSALGPSSRDGRDVTGYAFTVDPAKVPQVAALGSAAAGIAPIPVTFYLDGQNRPAEVDETVTVQGMTIQVTAVFSRYDEPVTITAPPADQVATG